jgi:hypothetical protein
MCFPQGAGMMRALRGDIPVSHPQAVDSTMQYFSIAVNTAIL